MTENIIIALIAGGLAVISNLIIAAFSNSKTIYRIDLLEKKVEEHNKIVERVYKLEQDDAAQWRWIDSLKGENNGQ